VNSVNELGMTPLHEAVVVENLRICKDLCIKGADRYAANKEGITPVQIAEAKKNDLRNFSSFKAVLSS